MHWQDKCISYRQRRLTPAVRKVNPSALLTLSGSLSAAYLSSFRPVDSHYPRPGRYRRAAGWHVPSLSRALSFHLLDRVPSLVEVEQRGSVNPLCLATLAATQQQQRQKELNEQEHQEQRALFLENLSIVAWLRHSTAASERGKASRHAATV